MTQQKETLANRLKTGYSEQLKIRALLLEVNLITVGSSYDRQIKAVANKMQKAATVLEANNQV